MQGALLGAQLQAISPPSSPAKGATHPPTPPIQQQQATSRQQGRATATLGQGSLVQTLLTHKRIKLTGVVWLTSHSLLFALGVVNEVMCRQPFVQVLSLGMTSVYHHSAILLQKSCQSSLLLDTAVTTVFSCCCLHAPKHSRVWLLCLLLHT